MEKMLLVDGYSLLFRAYYATAYGAIMRTSKGVPTNAVFAFSNMLNKAIKELEPEYVVVAFDKGKKNFRHDMFEAYKGTRKPAPDDLIIQFDIIREFLKAFAIPTIEITNYEADDVIGSLSRKFDDLQIDILSSDRDLLQLIKDNVNVLMIKKGITDIERMDENSLMAEYNLTPSQIIDFKGLSGDTSDNIPGIEKVGPKSATKLLNEYGTLENVLDHYDEIGGKIGERIKEGKEIALLSKKLATIKTDLDIDVEKEELLFKPNNFELLKFYNKYEMKSLASKLDISCSEVKKREPLCINSFALNNAKAFYYDFNHTNMFYFTDFENVMIVDPLNIMNDEEFQSLFNQLCLITYDMKEQMHYLEKLGLSLSNKCEDIRILQSLVDSSVNNELEILINMYSDYDFNLQTKALKEMSYEDKVQLFAGVVFEFNNIYNILIKKLREYDMEDLYYKLEKPLTFVLYDMEKTGVKVDQKVLQMIADECNEKLKYLKAEIYKYSNHEFNINSPKQLGDVLYDELALLKGKKRSTSVEILEEVKDKHPIINCILEYRKYAKLQSTYAEGLQKFIKDDGRIHTIYNQCLTTTGRLSSSDPNLQNISVRNPETREIRKAFVPSQGKVLLAADYSQVELRMLASLSSCKGLIDVFNKNVDLHTQTASLIFHKAFNDINSLERRHAKAVNFGIVYGISDFGLAKEINVTRAEAMHFIDSYYEAYPEIKEYMNNIINFVNENKYVQTILKRRRYINDIDNKNYMIRQGAIRQAMNAPVQGSAADLIKIAMVNIYNEIEKNHLKSKMILQVHDELIFEVEKDEIKIMSGIIKNGMEQALKLDVPLVAEVKEGSNWLEAK